MKCPGESSPVRLDPVHDICTVHRCCWFFCCLTEEKGREKRDGDKSESFENLVTAIVAYINSLKMMNSRNYNQYYEKDSNLCSISAFKAR